MAGVNKVILVGNLGKDPEIRFQTNGKGIANFSIATSETWKDKESGERQEKAEWHRIVAFEKLAEIVEKYVKKGSKLYVEGKLQTRKWEDKSGATRYTTEIVAREIQLLDSKKQDEKKEAEPVKLSDHSFVRSMQIDDSKPLDDDIPF